MNMWSLNGNWVDLVIVAILVYFGVEAYRFGLWVILADFISFLASLLISLKSYKFIADILRINFSLTTSLANAIGFLVTAILLEWVIRYFLGYGIAKIPNKFRKNKYTKFLAVFPGVGQGLILVAFFLTLAIALPIKPALKTDISNSKIGSVILRATSRVEANLGNVIGDAFGNPLTYMTIKPDGRESVPIEVETKDLTVDEAAEAEMFKLVNQERKNQGLVELNWYPDVVPVARAHARDMWERKYFSHYSPEGADVGDRLESARIKYFVAGENLALAPTTQIAHTGLMNSEGHRANILSLEFKRIGIGVIDNGYYGKMFVQIFVD